MKWFVRWTIVAAVLAAVVVWAWWFYFVDLRPQEMWLVFLSTGLAFIFIGALMAKGATEAAEESDQVFPYSSFKSTGIKGADVDEHVERRLDQAAHASPAVWGFVLVGAVTIVLGVGIKFL